MNLYILTFNRYSFEVLKRRPELFDHEKKK